MDFQLLIIPLPDNKHTVWSRSIQELLITGSAKAKELETLIGRLGHLGMILPFVYHFLSRLREWHHKSKNKRHLTTMPTECRLDLGLMMKFLDKAHDGIDMNLLSFRCPTHISHLPLRLVSFRTWRILRQRFCLEIRATARLALQSFEQPA